MGETTGNYTVLARRYRPQTFHDVVGQQHVAQALRNAIRAERVAHAYLFTGARGVGKTSMARILAKALNCPQAVDGNPCNKCDLCQAISVGSDVDVMEIDGASNRGIDDIRSLRANVGIRSMRTRVKMYIIDEVHMLTKEAFNALLKTLEEPPPNVKFVFCTTEPHKVPDTILSRCQRFDFSSIETQQIAQRLAEIAEQEGVSVAAEAIDLVARRAGGSMRDSQSLFDQLLAFGSERIESQDVNLLLGTADDERLLKIIQCVHQKRQQELLEEIDQSVRDGVQLGNLLDQLVNCYRDLMIVRCGAERVELIGVGPSVRETLIEFSKQLGIHSITAAMQILSEAKSRLSRVSHGRALLDLALIRISLLEDLDSLAQLVTDLKNGTSGTVTVQSTAPPANPSAVPSTVAPAQMTSPSGASAAAAAPAIPPLKPVSVSESVPVVAQSAPNPSPAPVESVREVNGNSDSDSAQKKTAERESEPLEAGLSPTKVWAFEEKSKEELWAELLLCIDDTIRTHLKKVARLAIIAPNRLDIFFGPKYAFSKSYFEDKPDLTRRIETQLRSLTQQNIQVRFCLEAGEEQPAATERATPTVSTVQGMKKHDFVISAETIFSATVARTDRLRKQQDT